MYLTWMVRVGYHRWIIEILKNAWTEMSETLQVYEAASITYQTLLGFNISTAVQQMGIYMNIRNIRELEEFCPFSF